MRIRLRGTASVLVSGLLSLVAVAACGHAAAQPRPSVSAPALTDALGTAGSEASAAPSAAPQESPSPEATPKPPRTGDVLPLGRGTFRTAAGGTGTVGKAGLLRTYQVQVEDGITTFTPDDFATKVDAVLADSRSWIASKKWRFQRVGPGVKPSVYIRLASPGTVDRLCRSVGLDTAGQYSCRFGDYVVVNLRRWTNGVPGFGADLSGYRNMVINHEVGHLLGHGHASCPGRGRPAPVMQQQTISLQGCRPNPYPYPDGVKFVG